MLALEDEATIWIAYRLEKGRAPLSSCDGEPAPDLELIALPAPMDVLPLGNPNGERPVPPLGGSIGDVLAVEEPDLG